mgnify:CR=1 FL=1
MHALVPLGAGVLAWMIGTAIRGIARNPDQIREMSRHNPWTVLFKGRANTVQEEKDMFPNGFFSVYGACGLVATIIGYGLGGLGLVALAVSISKRLL